MDDGNVTHHMPAREYEHDVPPGPGSEGKGDTKRVRGAGGGPITATEIYCTHARRGVQRGSSGTRAYAGVRLRFLSGVLPLSAQKLFEMIVSSIFSSVPAAFRPFAKRSVRSSALWDLNGQVQPPGACCQSCSSVPHSVFVVLAAAQL
jgi:hypothetical protein